MKFGWYEYSQSIEPARFADSVWEQHWGSISHWHNQGLTKQEIQKQLASLSFCPTIHQLVRQMMKWNLSGPERLRPVGRPTNRVISTGGDDTVIGANDDAAGDNFTEIIQVLHGDTHQSMRCLLDMGMGVNVIHLKKAQNSGFPILEYTGERLKDADGLEVDTLGKVDLHFYFLSYQPTRTWTLEFVVLRDPPFDVALGSAIIKRAGLFRTGLMNDTSLDPPLTSTSTNSFEAMSGRIAPKRMQVPSPSLVLTEEPDISSLLSDTNHEAAVDSPAVTANQHEAKTPPALLPRQSRSSSISMSSYPPLQALSTSDHSSWNFGRVTGLPARPPHSLMSEPPDDSSLADRGDTRGLPHKQREDWEWDSQRNNFIRHYKTENKSLKEAARCMHEYHDFFATTRQWQRRVKAWGLEKAKSRQDRGRQLEGRSVHGVDRTSRRQRADEASMLHSEETVNDGKIRRLARSGSSRSGSRSRSLPTSGPYKDGERNRGRTPIPGGEASEEIIPYDFYGIETSPQFEFSSRHETANSGSFPEMAGGTTVQPIPIPERSSRDESQRAHDLVKDSQSVAAFKEESHRPEENFDDSRSVVTDDTDVASHASLERPKRINAWLREGPFPAVLLKKRATSAQCSTSHESDSGFDSDPNKAESGPLSTTLERYLTSGDPIRQLRASLRKWSASNAKPQSSEGYLDAISGGEIQNSSTFTQNRIDEAEPLSQNLQDETIEFSSRQLSRWSRGASNSDEDDSDPLQLEEASTAQGKNRPTFEEMRRNLEANIFATEFGQDFASNLGPSVDSNDIGSVQTVIEQAHASHSAPTEGEAHELHHDNQAERAKMPLSSLNRPSAVDVDESSMVATSEYEGTRHEAAEYAVTSASLAGPLDRARRALTTSETCPGLTEGTTAEPISNADQSDRYVSAQPDPLVVPSSGCGRSVALPEEATQKLRDSFDISSVKSVDDDIDSQASWERPQRQMVGEISLSNFLAQNGRIQSLCKEALSLIERHRLIRNLRRLLKLYHLDLTKRATIELETVTVGLLRRRAARLRIATRLLDTICPQADMDVSQLRHAAQIDRLEIEKWIEDHQISISNNVGQAPGDFEQSDSDSDTSSTAEEPDAKAVGITVAEHFLLTGEPFQNLLVNTKTFLLPADQQPLTRILMTIPSHRISFVDRHERSIGDRLKTSLEEVSGADWQWWPLTGSIALLKDGFTRIIWRCHCDELQCVELPSKHADQYKALIELRGSTTGTDHLCLTLRRGPAPLRWIPLFPNVLSPYKTNTPQSSQQGSQGSQLQQPSPTYQPPGPNASVSSNRTQGGGSSNSNPRTNTQNSCHSGLQITPSLQAYVLFGARREWPDLEMDHLNTRATKDDCTFFYELKARYCSLRGWWRRWLSIWQLSHCDFVKFERGSVGVFSRGYDLPSSSDYDYCPRKPQAQDPPITPHEFRMVLSVCTEDCPLRFVHRCRLGSNATLGLSKIPKRLKEWEYKAATPDSDLAWGLEACHKICALRVLLYNMIMLLVPYGFWAYWQGVHPKDMQNASIPTTVVVSMITLFWTLSGIIQVLREPLSSKA